MTPPSNSELDTPLKVQIKALLNGFRRSRQLPPLSLEELAVAIVTVTPNLTLVDLQRHIFTAFKYYNATAVENAILRGYHGSLLISQINATFSTLLRRFDLPFDVVYAESESEDGDGDDYEDELSVEPAAAQIFLQKHLTVKNKQPFPFLKLPAELRLQIYGHCLGLPKSGVSVRQAERHSMKKEVVVRTKDFATEMQLSEWEDVPAPTGVRARWDDFVFRNRHDGTLKCQDLRTHLALLSVNKEIFNEAMPVFYSINSFVCSDLFHLESFLATLAPERREQLRHISFFYTKNTHSKAAKAFKMLGEIQKLKRLDIVIDEADFVGLTKPKSQGERMFPDVLKLPGFHTLKSMRAVKTVQFHGNCDTIRQALQSWIIDSNMDFPKKKRTVRSAQPRAKAVRRVPQLALVSENNNQIGQEGEIEEDLQSDMEDTQDLTRDTTPDSSPLTSHFFDLPSPHPNTPRIGTANELRSPFLLQPGNSESYLANRFQMQQPLGEYIAPLRQPTEQVQRETIESAPKVNATAKPLAYLAQDYQPLPNSAARMLVHGRGQMGDWKTPVRPSGGDVSLLAHAASESLFLPMEQTASYPAPSELEPGMLRMEDLLEDRESYELLQ